MTSWITKSADGIQGPFEFQELRDKLAGFPSDTQFQFVGTAGWIGMTNFAIAKCEKELIPPPPPLPRQMFKGQAVPPPPPIPKPASSSEVPQKSTEANRRDFMGGIAAIGTVVAAAFGGMKKTAKKIPGQINDTANHVLPVLKEYGNKLQREQEDRLRKENSPKQLQPFPQNRTPKK